jgi:hypothetical protein
MLEQEADVRREGAGEREQNAEDLGHGVIGAWIGKSGKGGSTAPHASLSAFGGAA